MDALVCRYAEAETPEQALGRVVAFEIDGDGQEGAVGFLEDFAEHGCSNAGTAIARDRNRDT
jgi:hypothetical protein